MAVQLVRLWGMIAAHLESLDGKKQSLELDIIHIAPVERFQRTLRALGLWWGLCIASVFVPMVHFVLVPTLFVIGAITASRKWLRTIEVNAKGLCPNCSAPMRFNGLLVNRSTQEFCSVCRHQSRVVWDENSKPSTY